MKYTADYITYMLTYRHIWHPRTHIIIPNLSWGLLPWEADLAIFTPAGYLTEVEIKCTKVDLLKDGGKLKFKRNEDPLLPSRYKISGLVKEFYYAVPESLVSEVPADYMERAGVISVPDKINKLCYVASKAPNNNGSKKYSERDLNNLYRLLSMRFWREFSKKVRATHTL